MTFKSEMLNEQIDILPKILSEKMPSKLYYAMNGNAPFEKIGEICKNLSEIESYIINSPDCIGKECVIIEVDVEVEFDVKCKNVSLKKIISVEEE